MSEIPRNPLSCTRCKAKKIKCGREEPKCDQCHKVSNADCFYPTRRQKVKTAKKRTDVLSQILQRLDTLERRTGVSPQGSHLGDDATSPGGEGGSLLDEGDNDGATDTDGGRTENETPLKSLYQLMNEAASTTKNVLDDTAEDTPPEADDAGNLFSDTLASIRTFRWKDRRTGDSNEKLVVPEPLAQKWIELSFQSPFYAQLIGTSNKYLMKAMPNIMQSTAIQVHLSVVVVYYSALFCGWRSDEGSTTPDLRNYGRSIYRECLKLLPAWKNDGHVTTMDFIALGLMTLLAIENFDYHLGWDLHLASCDIARELKLDKLDDVDPQNRPKEYETEFDKNVMRKKFWQLIHLEYFFRLYYDKPASMTLRKFSVNFPTITATSDLTPSGETVYFILNSRMVFITREFFDILERPDEDLKTKVDSLSDQIEDSMKEWNIAELLETPDTGSEDRWMYADILINGYITIILMERKAFGSRDKSILPSARSTYAARKTLETTKQLSNFLGHQSSTFLNFLSFYPFVAFFTLYHHILDCLRQRRNPGVFEKDGVERDIELIESLSGLLGSLAASREEFGVIADAITALTKVSRQMLATSMPPTPASASLTPGGSSKIRTRSRRSVELSTAEASIPLPDFNFPRNAADGTTWPLLEAGAQQPGLQTPLFYVESIESDLFGKNWHQSWFDQ